MKVLPRDEAFAIPDLIRTKINLLPPGISEVRTIEIVGLDLQADGGTHVANTREVGSIRVTGYESKGRINKRIRIELVEPDAARPMSRAGPRSAAGVALDHRRRLGDRAGDGAPPGRASAPRLAASVGTRRRSRRSPARSASAGGRAVDLHADVTAAGPGRRGGRAPPPSSGRPASW